ncbi:hypothetical protein AVEN_41523-1 [Araneus ventricosus]|uniref:Uncharacterized protein n=1 Tax=Araneus ventricosus TaxID=182803 RepID=A0A4Y2RJC6_ARAVE|nr:hypothetical protein AVEN_41523-1 [Araneus ventricosus]
MYEFPIRGGSLAASSSEPGPLQFPSHLGHHEYVDEKLTDNTYLLREGSGGGYKDFGFSIRAIAAAAIQISLMPRQGGVTQFSDYYQATMAHFQLSSYCL